MASVVTEQSGAGIRFEGPSSGHQCKSGESLAEWRSSEQVLNATPSTSPPYWDSDDDDEGLKPSDLYGHHTWKIDKFSQINKRELRSDPFEAGGYKWYILIYPQGCDVLNHLSLFLCVANHDKLLPGWSHYAQFTITLVNKDPKKSKDSDTLHRFMKKEHDWGWKKFMELSKVLEDFVEEDTLVIKAKVQVIRERKDRLFRCLSYEYRRELARRYLINVEQIFRRFVEERRGKFWKLIEDKAKWSSFCSFWLAMDQSSRCSMSRAKSDAIRKVVVKNFFNEKDVNSTLVMDSLYTGLKAIEGQSSGRKSKHIEAEDQTVPIIRMDEDVFVLVDDVLPLLERAAKEPLTPNNDKGLQNRMKDVGAGEESEKDISECDERRLTELGRRTIEIFILAHVFSKIEVAYQEAVAFRKQEELIQEEAAWLAKGRCGEADNKKSKKKQGKQKRNNRKGKDKCRDEKSTNYSPGNNGLHSDVIEIKEVLSPRSEITLEKSDALEDFSDVSDPIDDGVAEIIPPESEDTDNSEIHLPTEISSMQNSIEDRSSSLIGDSSSTCSSDSFTAVVSKRSQNGNSLQKKDKNSGSRGKNHGSVVSDSSDWVNGEANKSFRSVTRESRVDSLPQAAVLLSKDRMVNGDKLHAVKKEEKTPSLSEKVINCKASRNPDTACKNPTLNFSISPANSEPKANAANEVSTIEKLFSDTPEQAATSLSPQNSVRTSPTADHQKAQVEKLPTQRVTVGTEKPSRFFGPGLSRPLSAPITPKPSPAASTSPMAQNVMSRSVSFAGCFGTEPFVASAQSYVPQSYRGATTGGLSSNGLMINASLSYTQASTSLATPPTMVTPHNLPFGMINHHRDAPLWRESIRRDHTSNYLPADCESLISGHVMAEEFPHLDIINELLDDDAGVGRLSSHERFGGNGLRNMDRQFSFPGEALSGPGPFFSPSRLERMRSYHHDNDRVWLGYNGASRSFYDVVPQMSPRQHRNGYNGSALENQWRSNGSDVPYHAADYYQLSANGYMGFRPSNGT